MPSRRRSTPAKAPRRSSSGLKGRSKRPTPSPSPFPSPPPTPTPRRVKLETPPALTFRADPIDHLFPGLLASDTFADNDAHVLIDISNPTGLDELARVHGEISRRRLEKEEERQRQRDIERQRRRHPDPGPSDPKRRRGRTPVELFSAPSRPVAPSPERHPLAELRALAARSPSPEKQVLTFDDDEDPALFAELAQFLGSEEAVMQDDGSDDDGEDTYEARRLRRLKQNEMLLAQLGLVGGKRTLADSDDEDMPDSQSAAPTPSKRKSKAGARGRKSVVISEEAQKAHAARRAELDAMYGKGKAALRIREDGTTRSLPPRGSFYEVAFVEPPLLRERIRTGFTYCEGLPNLPPPKTPDPEPTPELVEVKPAPKAPKVPRGEGLEEEGTSCHQCRRKTPEAKMRCRHHEGDLVCPLFFCQNCITVRYGIPFDLDNRSFKCPRCSGFCNCSRCLLKAGWDDLVPGAKGFQRGMASLSNRLKDKDGKLIYKSVHEYIMSIKGKSVWGTEGLSSKRGPAEKGKKAERVKGEGDGTSTETAGVAKKPVKITIKKSKTVPAAGEASTSIEAPRRKFVVKLRRPSGRAEGDESGEMDTATQAQLNGDSHAASTSLAKAGARPRPAHDESHVWVKNQAEVSDSDDDEDEYEYVEVEAEGEDGQAQNLQAGSGEGEQRTYAAKSRGAEEDSESDLSSVPSTDDVDEGEGITFASAAERAAIARYGGLAPSIVDYGSSDEDGSSDSDDDEEEDSDDEGGAAASSVVDDKMHFEEGAIEDSFEAGVVESVVPSFYDPSTGVVSTAPITPAQLAMLGPIGSLGHHGQHGSPVAQLTSAAIEAMNNAATHAALRQSFEAGVVGMEVDSDSDGDREEKGLKGRGRSVAHAPFASSDDAPHAFLDNVLQPTLVASSSGAEDVGRAAPGAGGMHLSSPPHHHDEREGRWNPHSTSISGIGTSSPSPFSGREGNADADSEDEGEGDKATILPHQHHQQHQHYFGMSLAEGGAERQEQEQGGHAHVHAQTHDQEDEVRAAIRSATTAFYAQAFASS